MIINRQAKLIVYLRTLICLFAVLLLQSCQLLVSSDQMSPLGYKDVIKSDNDQRQYRYIRLENNLDVLLISDPDADKAAASLDIYMGSYQNPRDRLGLAHFLEHMLFLGTAKYPEPGEYQAFISQHGGSHNAYTSSENTNYFFDVDVQYLEQALDRFAPFFISPNFDADYVDRERNAVESEYRLRIKNDIRRQWDVLREHISQDHPQSKFTVGNLDTLSDRPDQSIRDDLIAMYDQYYSANLMKLVVSGAESLDQLQSMVSSRFAAIKDKQVQIKPHDAPFVEPAELPMQFNIKPVKELRQLSLMFEIPSISNYWRTKPAQYIASLIGHEETGSLLDVLKNRGWAESLGAGLSIEDRSGGLFSITISLTPEGLANRNALVEQVFAWIELIKEQGIESWRQDELARMGDINFKYLEKQNPSRYVSMLASRMHIYPVQEVLREPYLTPEFDKQLIDSLLSNLTPDNLILLVTAPHVEVDRLSEFYQVPYLVKRIDKSLVSSWQSPESFAELKLPAKNPFIPSDLSLINLKNEQAKQPELILKANGMRVWHLENTQFGVPRANIIIKLATDQTSTIEQATAAELYINLVQDQLNSSLYAASLAGLNYALGVDQRGISIILGGYSQNQELLLESVLQVLRRPDWSSERFQRVKEQLKRTKLNAQKDYPFRQVVGQLQATMRNAWTAPEQAPILDKLTMAKLKDYSQQLMQGFEIDVIISGNHDRQAANQIIVPLGVLSTQDINAPFKILKLPKSDFIYSIPVDHSDTVVMRYIQGDSDSLQERAKLSLIAQMISAPFFNTLRTEKQLGYVVSAFFYPINRVPGVAMLVQSPVASVSQLQDEFKGFTEQFATDIEQLSIEEFTRHQNAVLTNLQETPKSLSEMNGRFAESLNLGYTDFQFRDLLAEQIRALTVSDIQQAYKRIVLESPRQLWVQTQDNDDGAYIKPDIVNDNAVYRYSF